MIAAERLPPIRVDRTVPSRIARFQDPWVPFPEGIAVIKEMKRLLDRPDEGRPKSLALLADPSFGKSHLLDYFADCFPDIADPEPPRIQVLSIELPPEADSVKLLRELLRSLKVDYSLRHPSDELLRKVVVHVQSMRVGLIVVDEFHNALSGRRDRVLGVLQTVRGLSNRGGRPIVVAGTTKVKEVLRNDEQLNQRFVQWQLPLWNDVAYVMSLLSNFEQTFGSTKSGTLSTEANAKIVINLSKGRPGTIATLLRESHREALRINGGVIDKAVLDGCAELLVGRTVTA